MKVNHILLLLLTTLLSVYAFAQNQNEKLYKKLAGTYVYDVENKEFYKLRLTINDEDKYKIDYLHRMNFGILGKIRIVQSHNHPDGVLFFNKMGSWYQDNAIILQNYDKNDNNSKTSFHNLGYCSKKFIKLTKSNEYANNVNFDDAFRCIASEKPLIFPINQDQFTCFYAKDDYIDDFYLKPKYQAQTKAFTEQELKFEIKGRSFGFLKPDMQYFEVAKFDLDGFTYKLIIYNTYGIADATLLNTQINSYDKEGNLIDALLLDSRFSYEKVKAFSKFAINQDVIYVNEYIIYTVESDGEIGNPIPEDRQTLELYKKFRYYMDGGKFILANYYDPKAIKVKFIDLYKEIITGKKEEIAEDFLHRFYTRYIRLSKENNEDQLVTLRKRYLTDNFLCKINNEFNIVSETEGFIPEICSDNTPLACIDADPILCSQDPDSRYPYSGLLLFNTLEIKALDEFQNYEVCQNYPDTDYSASCLKVFLVKNEDGFLIDNVIDVGD